MWRQFGKIRCDARCAGRSEITPKRLRDGDSLVFVDISGAKTMSNQIVWLQVVLIDQQ
jgi:hypothetical protein